MRLCFINQGRIVKQQDSYYGFPAIIKLLEMLSPLYDEIALCAPLFDSPGIGYSSRLNITNVKLCLLPQYSKKWEIAAFRHPFMLIRHLWAPIRHADVVLITIPNYISVLACLVCLLQRKRYVVRLAGDSAEVIKYSFQNKGMYFLGRIAGFMHRVLMRAQVLASGLAIANGKQLADVYSRGCRHVVCCTSSTYKLTDIVTSIAGSGCEELRLLYVGRLIFNKGLFELFEASRVLLSEGLKFRIVVAGDGSRREEIKAKAEELGMIDKVDFPGWVAIDKLKDIYRSCDIFVFPSYTEGMAKAVTEAMSNGLPVIATSVGGLPDVVADGQTGILVQPKDVASLREAMRKLIMDGQLRKRMATAGLNRSCDFTIEAERECVRSALVSHGFLKVHPNTS